jgi:hypothetical protein
MPGALKAALEDLLRARQLQADAPPLRGEDLRQSGVRTGIAAIDQLLGGGFPRGEVSEVHGPSSSGRTALVFSLVGRSTAAGSLCAWVDAADRLDPASAAAAGVDLQRLLWLRGAQSGRGVAESISAAATLLGAGLFEVVVLDLVGMTAGDLQRLPGSTWIRLQRTVRDSPTALVLLAPAHTARSAGGVSLELHADGARWSGAPGPGRLLRGLHSEARLVVAGVSRTVRDPLFTAVASGPSLG